MCVTVQGLGDEISMAPQRASDLSLPRGRSGDELARGALVSLYACSLHGFSLVDYDRVLGGTWESCDSLTSLEACLCAPHILFLMMSGEELSDLAARTIKHFPFRPDLILSIHLLSQAPASLAMKHSAVWSEHPVSRRGFACLSVQVTLQRDPLSHGVSSPKGTSSEPPEVMAVLTFPPGKTVV